jgi:transposase
VTRDQKIASARELREQGFYYREIGERYGVSFSTVYRWLHPERAKEFRHRNREALRAYDREYNRTHRAECPSCGGEMDRETGRGGGICAGCRADEVDRRAAKIERWWADGLTLKEIAQQLDWSEGHISNELHRLREKGYDLPYRHRGFDRFPDQAPA